MTLKESKKPVAAKQVKDRSAPTKPDTSQAQIDELDQEIVDKLNERARLAEGLRGGGNGDESDAEAARESKTLRKILAARYEHIKTEDLDGICRQVVAARDQAAQPKLKKVCCLGPRGSFTHLAATRFFQGGATYELVDDVQEVFQRLYTMQVDRGILAVGNSITGPFGETLDMIREELANCPVEEHESPLAVCGEQFLRVEHCLVGLGPLEKVTTVFTHSQGYAQCRKTLEKLLPDADIVLQRSTSEAAQRAAKDQSGTAAAISNRLTADLVGLNVLREHLQDARSNITRFLIIGRHRSTRSGHDRTMLWMRLKDEPGSLVKALEVTDALNIKLTPLPIRDVPWGNSFLIELDGHVEDASVKAAIETMRRESAPGPQLLGSFERCREYEQSAPVREQEETQSTFPLVPAKRRSGPKAPSFVNSPLTVGIIGIDGDYGTWLKQFFEHHFVKQFDYQVIGSDIKLPNEMTNQKVVEQADVVIFAVSIDQAENVILEVAPFSHANQLWVDITSLKERPLHAMLSSEAEVIGLHPMCAPPESGNWRGETVVVCPVRCPNWLDWLHGVLDISKAKQEIRGGKAHDELMAIVQCLPHAVYLLTAAVMRRMDADVNEVMKFATPPFRLLWLAMNRVLSHKPELYADLQMLNSGNSVGLLDQILEEAGLLREIVKGNDRRRFCDEFIESRNYLGPDHLVEAGRRFTEIIRFNIDLDNDNSFVIYKEQDRAGMLREAMDDIDAEELNMTSLHSFPTGKGYCRFRIGTEERRDSEIVQRVIERLKQKGWKVV